jgi:hypothetical protein
MGCSKPPIHHLLSVLVKIQHSQWNGVTQVGSTVQAIVLGADSGSWGWKVAAEPWASPTAACHPFPVFLVDLSTDWQWRAFLLFLWSGETMLHTKVFLYLRAKTDTLGLRSPGALPRTFSIRHPAWVAWSSLRAMFCPARSLQSVGKTSLQWLRNSIDRVVSVMVGKSAVIFRPTLLHCSSG